MKTRYVIFNFLISPPPRGQPLPPGRFNLNKSKEKPLTRSFAMRIHDLSHKGRGDPLVCSELAICPRIGIDNTVWISSPLVGEFGPKVRVRGNKKRSFLYALNRPAFPTTGKGIFIENWKALIP
jgi:hypothetical protein